MDEKTKNNLVGILAVLTVLLFIGTVGSFNASLKERKLKEKEMATRMDAEEKLNKFSREESGQVEKIKSLQQALDAAGSELEAVKKTLAQEQMVNSSLKDDLQKITKRNEALEEKIKEPPAIGKSQTIRK